MPQFKIDARISFLVDTGADSSLIAPADAKTMGIDYTKLGTPIESIGIGGVALSYPVRGSLVFTDSRFMYLYHLDALDIAVPQPEIEQMPSLLGREVLGRWRIVCDSAKDELSFIVRSSDATLKL